MPMISRTLPKLVTLGSATKSGLMRAVIRGRRKRGLLPMAAALLLALAGLAYLGQGLAIHAKALLAQLLLERAFARSIAEGGPVKPWSWADTWPVARVEMPRIGLDSIVLASASGQAMAFGPGHLEGTPLPGDDGTAVIAAHRDTHFAELSQARTGDEIRVTRNDGLTLWFRVTSTAVVNWDGSGIDPMAEGHFLVLSTCWPFGATESGPLRYLVKAQMIASERRTPLVHKHPAGARIALAQR
jgi:sortase A